MNILNKLKKEEQSGGKTQEEIKEIQKESEAAKEAMRIHMSIMPDWAKESLIIQHPEM